MGPFVVCACVDEAEGGLKVDAPIFPPQHAFLKSATTCLLAGCTFSFLILRWGSLTALDANVSLLFVTVDPLTQGAPPLKRGITTFSPDNRHQGGPEVQRSRLENNGVKQLTCLHLDLHLVCAGHCDLLNMENSSLGRIWKVANTVNGAKR